MIKEDKDLRINKIENLRGGKATALVKPLIEGEELKGKAKMFSKITLPKGASIGEHAHIDDFEVYYILSGVGEVEDNGEKITVKPGDVIYTCDGQKHSIENIGDNDLEFIAVVINE